MDLEINFAYLNSHSICSMPEGRNVTFVGQEVIQTRIYRYYVDNKGDYWYKTFYIDEDTGEVLTQEEKIFGTEYAKKMKGVKHAWDIY